jgi:GNAT superfamily N-acetyltransferase
VPEPCELLEWDSKHFGVRIARHRDHRLNRESAVAAERWAAERVVDCLYLLADPDDEPTSRLAAERGYQLTDVRVETGRSLGDEHDVSRVPEGVEIRLAADADRGALRELAGRSHRSGRFHHDARFPADRADELYRRWIERDLTRPEWEVLVAEDADGIAGYLSGRADGEIAAVSLTAVDERARRRGVGSAMLHAILAAMGEAGAREMTSAVNGRNVAGLRLHARGGFAIRSVGLWYHRWLSAPTG